MLSNVSKKLACLIFAGVMLGVAVAEAGTIPTSSVPLYTYATKKIYCYNSPGGAQKGYIDPGDDITITKVQSNGWVYGNYPTSKGRVSRWFKASDLLADRSANYTRYAPTATTNVYRNSSHKTTMGSVNKNETITVVGGIGNSRQIIYKLSNGTGYKMGWIPSQHCWTASQLPKKQTVTTSISAQSNVSQKVKEKIDYLGGKVAGYKVSTKYTGSGQCRGFANKVYGTLFSGVSNITGYTNDNYGATSYGGSYVVGRLANFGQYDTTSVKNLFMKAKSGAFVQMGRRHSLNSTKSAPAPHSAIVASVFSDGVNLYEANTDGRNTIQINWYTWAKLADRNKGFTIYMPNRYVLK